MWYRTEAKQRRNGGFTLVELLLVVTILGILAAVVVARTTNVGTDARIQATKASIAGICTAVGMFEARSSRLPDAFDELTTDTADRPALLNKSNLNDAWGHPFEYKKISRTQYEVRSAGVDEQMGTADDLLNPS